jgi:hypothetical protein
MGFNKHTISQFAIAVSLLTAVLSGFITVLMFFTALLANNVDNFPLTIGLAVVQALVDAAQIGCAVMFAKKGFRAKRFMIALICLFSANGLFSLFNLISRINPISIALAVLFTASVVLLALTFAAKDEGIFDDGFMETDGLGSKNADKSDGETERLDADDDDRHNITK